MYVYICVCVPACFHLYWMPVRVDLCVWPIARLTAPHLSFCTESAGQAETAVDLWELATEKV